MSFLDQTSYAATNLIPSSLYAFRIIVTNAAGSTPGKSVLITTLSSDFASASLEFNGDYSTVFGSSIAGS